MLTTGTLPDGWTKTAWRHNMYILEAPRALSDRFYGGFITVDEKVRGYALGCYMQAAPMDGYTGRGWKARLEADAVAALQTAARPAQQPKD